MKSGTKRLIAGNKKTNRDVATPNTRVWWAHQLRYAKRTVGGKKLRHRIKTNAGWFSGKKS